MRRGGAKSSRGVRQPYQRQGDKLDPSRPAGMRSNPVSPRPSAEGIALAATASKPEECEPRKSQTYPASPKSSTDAIAPATAVIKPQRPPIKQTQGFRDLQGFQAKALLSTPQPASQPGASLWICNATKSHRNLRHWQRVSSPPLQLGL
ncbi:hypothetical protein MRX96_011745 [Rhipicephalus microplus]